MAGSSFSMTQHGRSEPFDLQVSRGVVNFHSSWNVYGYQLAVAQTFIPVWENATAYTFPPSALTMTLTGSVGDAATVRIFGLDANYNQITEDVSFTGATPANTVNQFLRINRLIVIAGTTPGNAVTLSNGGTTYGKISAGFGRSQMSIYTVPAGYTYYKNAVFAWSNQGGGSNAFCQFRVYTTDINGVVNIRRQAPFVSTYEHSRQLPHAFTEKTDIQWQFQANSSTAIIGCEIEGTLIKETAT